MFKQNQSKFIFIIISLINISAFSQNSGPLNKNKPNRKFLTYNKSKETSVFFVSYQHLYIPKSRPFATVGMHFTLGLNIARPFTNKFIIGFCYDLKQIPSFRRQHFSDEFINDFNSSFISAYTNIKDSARGYTLKGGINHDAGFGITGN